MRVPLFSKKQKDPLFLTIVLTNTTTAAAVWAVRSGGIEVRARSQLFPIEIFEDHIIAESIDTALDELGDDGNITTQVLFSLPFDWISGATIVPQKKQLLKNICQKMALKSVGFVVTAEAIAAYRRDQHKAGKEVVVYVEGQFLDMCMVDGVAVSRMVRVSRSSDIAADLLEGLTQLSASASLSHIVIGSAELTLEDLHTIEQELITSELPAHLFPAAPSVEVLSHEEMLDAASVSGGKEVVHSLGILVSTPVIPTAQRTPEPAIEESSQLQEIEGEVLLAASRLPSNRGKRIISKIASLVPKKIGVGLILAALFLLGVGGTAVFALSRMVSAHVVLMLKPTEIKKPIEFTLDSKAASSDPSALLLKGEVLTQELSGSKEIPTSGKKTVGEKAKGSVALFNRTSIPKEFKAGTVLTYSSKVALLLDSDVTVASASSGTNYETIPGKASVKVTARDIGEESNIEKDVELTIANFDKSAFVARTEDKLTGGTSKEVRSVSAQDQKDVVDAIVSELKAKVKDEIQVKIALGDGFIVNDQLVVTKREFNAQVGEEKESLAANVTASASAIVYRKVELDSFVSQLLASELPVNSTLIDGKTSVIVETQQLERPGAYKVRAMVTAYASPVVTEDQFVKLLAGKSVEEAHQILSGQSSIGSFTLNLNPKPIGTLFGRLPSEEKITIESKLAP